MVQYTLVFPWAEGRNSILHLDTKNKNIVFILYVKSILPDTFVVVLQSIESLPVHLSWKAESTWITLDIGSQAFLVIEQSLGSS